MGDFVDDGMTQGHVDKHWKRLAGASLLALCILGHPLGPDEHIPRDDLVSTRKLLTEGVPIETQVALGLQINTRLISMHCLMSNTMSRLTKLRKFQKMKGPALKI